MMHANGIYLGVPTNLFLVNELFDTLSSSHLVSGDLDFRVLEIGFVNFRYLVTTSVTHRKDVVLEKSGFEKFLSI